MLIRINRSGSKYWLGASTTAKCRKTSASKFLLRRNTIAQPIQAMTNKPIFESTRQFTIYSYTASHGLLLFRSGKTSIQPTRIDILFQDVRAIETRAWFDGIKIEEAGIEFLLNRNSSPIALMEPGNKVYRLVGVGWEGFVLAGILSFCEDEEDFFSSSKLT